MSRNFEEADNILKAGQHSALLETIELEDGDTKQMKGTAFFVSEYLPLTAAHCVIPPQGKVKMISFRYPGLKKVHPMGANYTQVSNCRSYAKLP